MSLWIVGSSGMLGSAVVQVLEREGLSYLATSRNQVDITDPVSINEFCSQNQINAIVNAAAYTAVDLAEKKKKQCFQVNVEGSLNLARAAKKLDCPYIFISTDYVFSGEEEREFQEKDVCAPVNTYGKSKYFAELLIQNIYPQACILRTSWLFSEKKVNFLTKLLKRFETQTKLQIVNDQRGRPTYCLDLAKVTLQLIGRSGVYHFCNSGSTNWYQFACEIYELARKKQELAPIEIQAISSNEYVTNAKRPACSILSTQKIEEELCLIPRHWNIALNEAINQYYRELCQTIPSRS